MSEPSWHPGHIFSAWEQVHKAVVEVLKEQHRRTLEFLAVEARERIVRESACEVLDWLSNRHLLPDWGWTLCKERLRATPA